ncbi:MAG: excinuclease ABC subunit UvrA [Bacteroidia bacterium]|nr:excinuclease ABC subunit UvrA [Bacteroidia bacterium]
MSHVPETIRIIGARQHTLKHVTVSLPRHKLTVICGWSGSGKTTLAFDTLYAEGFSTYVESLSTYVRQFLPRMPRPAVERIEGLAPAIALQQSRFTGGLRSTVASLSELYPYLRLLFARVGTLYSPISGRAVERYSLEEVVEFLLQQPSGTEILILRPFPSEGAESLPTAAEKLVQEGHDRFFWKETLYEWPDFPPTQSIEEVYVVVDRLFLDPSEVELRARLMESLEEVWYTHARQAWVWLQGKGEFYFSGQLYAEGYTFREPTPELFNYLSSYGACPTCQGRGRSLSLSEERVIPDPRKSLQEGLVALWQENPFLQAYQQQFIAQAQEIIPPDLPYYAYSTHQKRLLWWGDPLKNIPGIFASYEAALKERSYARALFNYQGEGACPACEGSRLHPDTRWIRIAERSLPQLFSMSIAELSEWLQRIELAEPQRTIAKPLLQELRHRTPLLVEVGLGYLTLGRAGETLSGGESQRLQLATVLGGQLTGAIYVLDEPTIGLHPRDTRRLLSVIQQLRNAPNTVVVVEHDENFIREAEYLIEMGPEAGEKGGEVVFTGTFEELLTRETHTATYFRLPPPPLPPPISPEKNSCIRLEGACLHNLKNISVTFPLQALTVVTGVSGSGKTTLVLHLLAPLLLEGNFSRTADSPEEVLHPQKGHLFKRLTLAGHLVQEVQILTQQNLSRNRRSIIATISGAYDSIRELFARAAETSETELSPSFFSFNVPGGRCETCQGEGVIIKTMQFLADVRLPCPSCGGKRFQNFILEVEVGGKNISDILSLTVQEALAFFSSLPKIPVRLKEALKVALEPFLDLGLGYLKLGQATTELSGGEATRLKLLPYLQPNTHPTLFLIDEPTTGLHFDDVTRLISAFRHLTRQGHTLIVVEHNLDLIAQADWVIDLGPEGGDEGGYLVYEGPIASFLNHPTSYTAAALREKYARGSV